MQILTALVGLIALLDFTQAKYAKHAKHAKLPTNALNRAHKIKRDAHLHERHENHKRFVTPPDSRFLTNKTRPFVVDGVKLPELNFDPGESYAGTTRSSDQIATLLTVRQDLYL